MRDELNNLRRWSLKVNESDPHQSKILTPGVANAFFDRVYDVFREYVLNFNFSFSGIHQNLLQSPNRNHQIFLFLVSKSTTTRTTTTDGTTTTTEGTTTTEDSISPDSIIEEDQ